MNVTQKDIAKKLNVSIMTVSKALKGHSDIALETRRLVEKTAREMNYTVNAVARNLVQKRTNTIGIVIPDISESFYAEMVRGIESYTRPKKYNILLADSDNNAEIENQALQTMLEKRVDGLLFCPTEKSNRYVDILKSAGIPIVFINSKESQLKCDSIYVDRASGAYRAISHLLERGYKKLYFFYTLQQMLQSQRSVEGCWKAFNDHKKSGDSLEVVYCEEHDIDVFYKQALTHLSPDNQRIGIFTWDDEMAVGVYRAIAELGGDIPDKYGIVGFDDIKISRFLPKALTTIRYPKFEMGEKGAKRLLDQLESDQKLFPEEIQLQLELIKRETT